MFRYPQPVGTVCLPCTQMCRPELRHVCCVDQAASQCNAVSMGQVVLSVPCVRPARSGMSYAQVRPQCNCTVNIQLYIRACLFFWLNSSQMSSCQLCIPPLYADTAGASACVRCLAGSQAVAPLSNVTGSVKSEVCKEGWFR